MVQKVEFETKDPKEGFVFAPLFGFLVIILKNKRKAMFTNGYLYAIFLFITALLLSSSSSPKDITLGAFLIFLGVIACGLEYFKHNLELKKFFNKYF